VCVTHLPSREHFHANYDERVRVMELNSFFFLSFSLFRFLFIFLALVKEEEKKEEEKMNGSDDKKMTI
jgi:hypothetical protein